MTAVARSSFLERLRSGPPIVADGGMGALLAGAVPRLRCPEEANLRAPESVVAVHASYIAAGAELIETNSFGANRRKLMRHLLEEEFERINSTAVRLAREAREVAGREVWIAGSIGPLGELEVFDPVGHAAAYAEQAQVLEGRGVDLFMIETFFDLDELVVAVEAVREASSLPIVALLTFDEEAEVAGGVGAAEAARRLAELDVAAVGTNHGAGPARGADSRRGDGGVRPAARGAAERRPGEPERREGRLPARDAGLLRRVRRAGGGARRADRRRVLRHDAGADRGDPGRSRDRAGQPARPFVADERELALAPPRPPQERDGAGPRVRARASGSCASSSTRRRAARSTASSRWRAR